MNSGHRTGRVLASCHRVMLECLALGGVKRVILGFRCRAETGPVRSSRNPGWEGFVKLFINYRREDTDDLAGRLYDRLTTEFGAENIFKDVDSIRPGQNWKVELERSVGQCDVVLALIGKGWVTCVDAKGRRR